MSVGILVISHNCAGKYMMESAAETFEQCPILYEVITAARDCDTDAVARCAAAALEHLDTGEGVLVLTDMYGATPSNIASRLLDNPMVRLVSGLNLSMLLKVMNYADLPLDKLARKAVDGGREGIFMVEHA